jgi:hypothetical protein
VLVVVVGWLGMTTGADVGCVVVPLPSDVLGAAGGGLTVVVGPCCVDPATGATTSGLNGSRTTARFALIGSV